MSSTHICIICGRAFYPAAPDVVFCPQCGGPPEAKPEQSAPARTIPSQPTIVDSLDTPATPQPQKTVHYALEETAAETSVCIRCGRDFVPAHPDQSLCPACRRELGEIPSQGRPTQTTAIGTEGGPEWREGETVLEEYLVEKVLGEGGMGKVYLLRQRHTHRPFAVKRARGLSAESRRRFLAELQTWIDLPEHPNLVACRFFRTVGDEVLIFADYVEGGSLSDWIRSGRLYEGGHGTALRRMLDVAIQFAWGLHCLHRRGLVHQDVKPGNVLMGKDEQALLSGVRAQVSDFGLARGRAAGERWRGGTGSPLQVSSGGGTPAYCSPEQEIGQALTPATDVWSWGVSLLEMFSGEVRWKSGSIAGAALEAYLEEGAKDPSIPPMPPEVAALLRECFQDDPAARPAMETVVERLKAAYRRVAGKEYRRVLTEIARPVRAAGVEERLHKGGVRWEDPRVWLEWALRAAGRDPAEAEAILSRSGATRKGELVAQLAAYEEARRIYEGLIAQGREELREVLAKLCLQKALIHETAGDASGTLQEYDRAIAILERLVEREGRGELANELALAYMNKAEALRILGEGRAALGLYDRAIAIRERLVEREGRSELANELARAYMNKANALQGLGELRTALGLYDRAIALYEWLVEREGRGELVDKLAMACMNKATALKGLGELRTALGLYDRAIALYERLVEREGRGELANGLAAAYMNKAEALRILGEGRAALGLIDRAIAIWERLVEREGRSELADDLAGAYMNKANALQGLGELRAALGLYDRAIAIRERLVEREGRSELADKLARAYMNKAIALQGLGELRAALGLFDRAIALYERLVKREGRSELADVLALAYMNKATALHVLGEGRAALGLYDRAIAILERLVEREGRGELANELASAYMNKAIPLAELGDLRAALGLCDRAIALYERLVEREGRQELLGDLGWVKGLRAFLYLQSGQHSRGVAELRQAVQMLQTAVARTGRADLQNVLNQFLALLRQVS